MNILLKVSAIGGLAGLISEMWYFNDYWRPPTLLGNSKISIEDFLFGFSFTGIAALVYKVIVRKRPIQAKSRKKLFLLFFIIGFLSLLLFSNLLKINSIFVSSIAFLAFSMLMVLLRKDLIIQAVMSGLLSLAIIIPVYIFLFDVLSPHYWSNYWLLSNTIFGMKILGNIPLTELLWYFSWGCFAGIAFDFYHGR